MKADGCCSPTAHSRVHTSQLLMRLVTSVAVVAVLVAGSAGSVNAATNKSGGTITVAYDETPEGFNVDQATQILGRTPEIMGLVWPSAFVIPPNAKPQVNKSVVTSAKQTSTSPQTIVYTINPRATWSDGTPINAEDFIYNWEAQSGNPKYKDVGGKPFEPAGTAGYSQIKSVTGSNNGKTVTAVFSSPYSDWKTLFSDLVPAHIARKVGFNTGFANFGPAVKVSGGPYELQSYAPNQDLVAVANPHYWGPKPKIDKIIFRFITDDAQQPVAMQNNEVQVVEPFQATVPYLDSLKNVSGLTVKVVPGFQFAHIDFNEANPYLANVNIRHAIAYATNRSEIVKREADVLDPKIKPLDNRIFMPNAPYYQNTSQGYGDYKPAEAKKLLEEAGMTMGSDGYFHPKSGPEAGQDFTLKIGTTAGQEAREQIEELFQAQMKQVGVKIEIQDFSNLVTGAFNTGAFDMVLFNWDAAPFPSTDVGIYCSYTNQPACSSNYDRYADPKTDALMNKALNTSSPSQAAKYWNEADRQLWKDMATLPLFQAPEVFAWSDRYANVEPNPLQGIAWNAQDWSPKS